MARTTPHFTNQVRLNQSRSRNFIFDPENILDTKDSSGYIEKFSWNPVTGELLLIHPPQQHASIQGDAPFDDYVRAIILRNQKKVLFRPFWPTWMRKSLYDSFDQEAAAVSFDAQWQAKEMVEAHGGQNWEIEMNTNNKALAEMTGRRNW